MEVILKQDVTNVGLKGQLVKVKNGFFKNFLSQKGLAIVATPKLSEAAKAVTAKIEAEKAEKAKGAEAKRNELENKVLHLKEKLTAKGTLYAKVTEAEIAAAVKEQFEIDCTADMISLSEAIKEAGDYDFKLTLAPTVAVTIKLTVEGEES
jgi:large subunit ribosomal protein L9